MGRRHFARTPVALVAAACAAVTAAPTKAWSPKTQVAIANHAARVAPPALRRQIDRHARRFREGATAPFGDADAARHVKNGDGSGRLDRVIAEEVERAVRAIEEHRPFADIVYQMGVVAHYVADANNPLNASDADESEGRYFADYLRYLESAEPRFAVVFYGDGRDLGTPEDLAALVRRTLARSGALYPSIGQEYRRIGMTSGVGRFDDRSTAFGVGSLAFSHAVSDIAGVLRYIWIRAGGADRRRIPTLGNRPLGE